MNQESKEYQPRVELTIISPDDTYGWRIDFTSSSDAETHAYNAAIDTVLHKTGLIPYEITGQDNEPNYTAGHHSWSANPTHRARVTSADQLARLIPDIHREAEINLHLTA